MTIHSSHSSGREGKGRGWIRGVNERSRIDRGCFYYNPSPLNLSSYYYYYFLKYPHRLGPRNLFSSESTFVSTSNAFIRNHHSKKLFPYLSYPTLLGMDNQTWIKKRQSLMMRLNERVFTRWTKDILHRWYRIDWQSIGDSAGGETVLTSSSMARNGWKLSPQPTGPNRIPAASAKIPWRATAIFNFPLPLSYARQTWS